MRRDSNCQVIVNCNSKENCILATNIKTLEINENVWNRFKREEHTRLKGDSLQICELNYTNILSRTVCIIENIWKKT